MTIHDDAFGCGTTDPSNPGGGPVQFAEARLRPQSGRAKASGGAAAANDLLREQLIALLEGHGAHIAV